MKKLAALASMALLLCASASFAKKAMDEEEMDLVTAAGQPSVIDVNVETSGLGNLESTTTSDTYVQATADATSSPADPNAGVDASVGSVEATAAEANAALNIGELGVFTFPPPLAVGVEEASAALNIDYSNTEIETFSLSVGSATGTLTATASAAASSTVAGAIASITASNSDQSTISLLVASGSQSNLRAIVLNNVAGENQLANAINISAGSTANSGKQENTIVQSWGSTYDWSYAPGQPAGNSGNATAGAITTMGGCAAIYKSCNDASASTGDGGDAAQAVPLTITADKIQRVAVDSQGDAFVDVSENDKSTLSGIIDTDSQNNLAALIVNNVVGRNQVATALNVVSAGVVSIGEQSGIARVQLGVPAVGGSYNNQKDQINTIEQYRGTPKGH